MGDERLTVRVDPLDKGGFTVYLSANGNIGYDTVVS